MTEQDKKRIAYLLTGNNGHDLVTYLLQYVSDTAKDTIDKDIAELEKEGQNFVETYDECVGTATDIIWA